MFATVSSPRKHEKHPLGSPEPFLNFANRQNYKKLICCVFWKHSKLVDLADSNCPFAYLCAFVWTHLPLSPPRSWWDPSPCSHCRLWCRWVLIFCPSRETHLCPLCFKGLISLQSPQTGMSKARILINLQKPGWGWTHHLWFISHRPLHSATVPEWKCCSPLITLTLLPKSLLCVQEFIMAPQRGSGLRTFLFLCYCIGFFRHSFLEWRKICLGREKGCVCWDGHLGFMLNRGQNKHISWPKNVNGKHPAYKERKQP